MKPLRFFALIHLVCLMPFIQIDIAHAGNYLGEFTWKLSDGTNSSEYLILKLAITDMGNSHNLLNGRIENFENDTLMNTDIVHGNSEIVDNVLNMNLLNSFLVESGEFGYSSIRIMVDPTSLDGTFMAINTAYQFDSTDITKEFVQGEVVFLSKNEDNAFIPGDFDENGLLGLEDCIAILQTLTGARE